LIPIQTACCESKVTVQSQNVLIVHVVPDASHILSLKLRLAVYAVRVCW